MESKLTNNINSSKKSILIIDPCSPKPYSKGKVNGCGGTEITVVDIAEALGAKGHIVNVAQKERHTNTSPLPGFSTVWYSPETETINNPDYVIVLRIPEALLSAREKFPKAKLYFWCHDLFDNTSAIQTLAAWKATKPEYLFAVSEYHRAQIRNTFGSVNLKLAGLPEDLVVSPKIRVVYPSIADDLKPDNTPYDKNKMCFISSPHKGLENALDLFKHIRRKLPDLELHVTNPGYYTTASCTQAGVKVLGSVSHIEVLSLLRSSLCLFFPNRVFPETFGRVYAEAEAVGTPVLTHNLGAATEVLSDNREFVDTNDTQAVIDRISEWYNGRRPTVRMKRNFRLARIINYLEKELLCSL